MKSTRTLGPLWLWPVTLIIVGWLARAGWHLRSENETLRTVAAAAGKVDASTGTRATPELINGQQEGPVRAEALRDETRREIASREAAEAKIAEIESRLPTRDGEVVSSFGRIEEMGQRAGKAVMTFARQAAAQTAAQKPGVEPVTDLTKDEKTAFAAFLCHLGELRAVENDPHEIARFQAATLREVLGLDDATSGRVTAFLEAEFARLKAQQLTANFRPENEPGDWYCRRDAAITELAARLRPLLPANHAQLPLLPGILSLGGGPRTEVKLNPSGIDSVTMKLPLFPTGILMAL